MVFHWSLSDSKSPQVFRTLLSILAVFNNAVIWMVSTRPPTSHSSKLFNNLLVTVPKAPITIGIIVTFMFCSFFNSLCKVEVLISLFTFLQIYSVVSKVDNFVNSLFCCWLLLLLSLLIRVFHISVSWWSFTGDWVKASLLKSLDSFQYSGRFQQCCSLDGLHSAANFQIFPALY